MTDRDLSLTSTGNVSPNRFVKLGTAADHTGTQAGANDAPIGISGDGTRNAPGTAADDGYIAIAGETIPVYGPGRRCQVDAGGSFAAGDRLKSDTNGKAVIIASTGTTIQNVGARALTAGADGFKAWVIVEHYPLRPALS